jgi:hypothetical protein
LERRSLIHFSIDGCAVAVMLFAAACTSSEESDRRDLKAAFAIDAPLDAALAQAETEAKAGRDDAAADILKRTAEAAGKAAVDAANAVAPRTIERRDSVAAYESALRGTDLDEKLAAVEKQIELEKRVLAFSTEIQHPR